MINGLAIFAGLVVGMFFGLFVSGARRRINGVDGHVRIGGTWHEVDCHGRVIFRPEADNAGR